MYKAFSSRTRLAKCIKILHKYKSPEDILKLDNASVESEVYSLLAQPDSLVEEYFNKHNLKYTKAVESLKL